MIPMMNYIRLLYPILFFYACTGIAAESRKVRLNIFVHGIMSIKPHLSVANFLRFLTDNIENTIYSETVHHMRQDDFFYKNQAMQELGLHKIDLNRVEKGYASGLAGCLLNEVENLTDDCSNYENHYYNFGWYALLSARIRYQDAIPLYNSLVQEINTFRAQGIEPEVRLYGYSHGGNLCLNLGAVRQNEDVDQTLRIRELILLGVPIQCETDFLINDLVFERIYQIYSRGDRIQKLDFFSTKRFFSRRLFKSRKYFNIPDKLTQIQIRITRAVRGKHRTELPPFNIHDLPTLSGKSKRLRDGSPGHIELWFFGWTPTNYRPDLLIAPFPLLVFVPLILHQVNLTLSRAQAANPHKPVIVDIRPEYSQTIIKNQKSWKDVTITEFFDKQTLQQLADMTKPYVPDAYTIEDYEYHIEMALEKAKETHEKKNECQTGHRRRRTKHKAQRRMPFIKSTLIS